MTTTAASGWLWNRTRDLGVVFVIEGPPATVRAYNDEMPSAASGAGSLFEPRRRFQRTGFIRFPARPTWRCRSHACSGHDVVVTARRAEQQRRLRSTAQTRLPQVGGRSAARARREPGSSSNVPVACVTPASARAAEKACAESGISAADLVTAHNAAGSSGVSLGDCVRGGALARWRR